MHNQLRASGVSACVLTLALSLLLTGCFEQAPPKQAPANKPESTPSQAEQAGKSQPGSEVAAAEAASEKSDAPAVENTEEAAEKQAEDAPTTAQPAAQAKPEPIEENPGEAPAKKALVPFRSSWIHAMVVNSRPADGFVSPINPPRFSWPYVPGTVPESADKVQPTVFTFQLSTDPDFREIDFEIRDTPYNFDNAIPVLEDTKWYWRVGYGKSPGNWSTVRSFTFSPDAVEWDRTVINEAITRLARVKRPRTGPADGDWKAFYKKLKDDPATKSYMDELMRMAERTTTLPYWKDFPKTDDLGRPPKVREEKTRFIGMLKDLTITAYAYRLSGKKDFKPAVDYIVKMAEWPRGGLLSPEGLGGHTKMPSQAAEMFAVFYDWFADELSEKDAKTVKKAIAWRLHDMYFDKDNIIWNRGDVMFHAGLHYKAGSHPYQNYAWTVPAILLMAGDLEEADKLVPLALNFLTGVTASEGADEGYNEGHGYANEKLGTTLRAALVADLLLPELELGKNPMKQSLTDWFVFLFPGTERLPWGDSWLTSARDVGGENLQRVAYLTGDPVAKYFWKTRADGRPAERVAGQYSRPWFDIAVWDRKGEMLNNIEATPSAKKTLFLPEAGWVFVQSQPINSYDDFTKTVGMQFQMRPRGGYSHSYPSDGSFVWFAYGQALSVGGGYRSWMSQHFSRSPMSHNSLLINGEGHTTINPYKPDRPYTARPLAFQETKDYVYWCADLTMGYGHIRGVERVHRHVVFVGGEWFAIYDDIKLSATAKQSIFSYLFHVYQDVKIDIRKDAPAGFEYSVGRVDARVLFANAPGSLAVENREEKEAYVNPFTGEDMYPKDVEWAKKRSMQFYNQIYAKPLMKNSLWVNSTAEGREFHFLSVLQAAPGGSSLPDVQFDGEKKVTASGVSGKPISVSFDPAKPADINILVDRVRQHAEESAKPYLADF